MKTKLVLAALALCAVSSTASAQEPETLGVSQIEVPYGDLNLHHPAGTATMTGRIRWAASLVCGGYPATRELGDFTRYRTCVVATVQAAFADLNAVMVSRYQGGRSIVVTRR
jgi:UrcA family protein